MRESADLHSAHAEVLGDLEAARRHCRETGYSGRLCVRRDAAGRRSVVNLNPADRLIQIDREMAADRQARLATAERSLSPDVRRRLHLERAERELGMSRSVPVRRIIQIGPA